MSLESDFCGLESRIGRGRRVGSVGVFSCDKVEAMSLESGLILVLEMSEHLTEKDGVGTFVFVVERARVGSGGNAGDELV